MRYVDTSVTVRTVPMRLRLVLCSAWERQKIEARSVQALRDLVTDKGLHQRGDGDMLIVFAEEGVGGFVAKGFASVLESEDESPTMAWGGPDLSGAEREAVMQSAINQYNTTHGVGTN